MSQGSSSAVTTPKKSVLGNHKISVVVVTLPNQNAYGLTHERVNEMVAYADGLWSHVSFGKIRLTLDSVITQKKIGNPLAGCGMKLANSVALQISWVKGPKKHLVVFDRTRTCMQSKGEAALNGSIIFLNSWAEITDNPEIIASAANTFGSLLAHEFGHNLGLKHVAKSGCSLALEIPCVLSKERGRGYNEYGGIDLMGTGNVPFALNPIAQLKLGLLNDSALAEIQLGNRETKLIEIELSSARNESGIRAIKLVSKNKRWNWWISFDQLPICSNEWKTDIQFRACQFPWKEFYSDEFMAQFFNIRDDSVFSVQVHYFDKRISSVDAIQQFSGNGFSSLLENKKYPLGKGQLSYIFEGDKVRITIDLTD